MKIVKVVEGYVVSCYCENGKMFFGDEDFIRYLCEPHTDKYEIMTLFTEDLEDVDPEFVKFVRYYGNTYPNNAENFAKLLQIYNSY